MVVWQLLYPLPVAVTDGQMMGSRCARRCLTARQLDDLTARLLVTWIRFRPSLLQLCMYIFINEHALHASPDSAEKVYDGLPHPLGRKACRSVGLEANPPVSLNLPLVTAALFAHTLRLLCLISLATESPSLPDTRVPSGCPWLLPTSLPSYQTVQTS